jgi:hypothetical protein
MPKCHIACQKNKNLSCMYKTHNYLSIKVLKHCSHKIENLNLLAQNNNYLQPKTKKTNNYFP